MFIALKEFEKDLNAAINLEVFNEILSPYPEKFDVWRMVLINNFSVPVRWQKTEEGFLVWKGTRVELETVLFELRSQYPQEFITFEKELREGQNQEVKEEKPVTEFGEALQEVINNTTKTKTMERKRIQKRVLLNVMGILSKQQEKGLVNFKELGNFAQSKSINGWIESAKSAGINLQWEIIGTNKKSIKWAGSKEELNAALMITKNLLKDLYGEEIKEEVKTAPIVEEVKPVIVAKEPFRVGMSDERLYRLREIFSERRYCNQPAKVLADELQVDKRSLLNYCRLHSDEFTLCDMEYIAYKVKPNIQFKCWIKMARRLEKELSSVTKWKKDHDVDDMAVYEITYESLDELVLLSMLLREEYGEKIYNEELSKQLSERAKKRREKF